MKALGSLIIGGYCIYQLYAYTSKIKQSKNKPSTLAQYNASVDTGPFIPEQLPRAKFLSHMDKCVTFGKVSP